MRLIILFVSISFFTQYSSAQKVKEANTSNALYKTKPLWIPMMEDPNANYYEALKAFDMFWDGKIVPAETEGEAMDLGKEENRGGKQEDKEIPQESQQYVYEYKQFMNWKRSMKNMIDVETGRIMSIDEVQEIVLKERNKK